MLGLPLRLWLLGGRLLWLWSLCLCRLRGCCGLGALRLLLLLLSSWLCRGLLLSSLLGLLLRLWLFGSRLLRLWSLCLCRLRGRRGLGALGLLLFLLSSWLRRGLLLSSLLGLRLRLWLLGCLLLCRLCGLGLLRSCRGGGGAGSTNCGSVAAWLASGCRSAAGLGRRGIVASLGQLGLLHG